MSESLKSADKPSDGGRIWPVVRDTFMSSLVAIVVGLAVLAAAPIVLDFGRFLPPSGLPNDPQTLAGIFTSEDFLGVMTWVLFAATVAAVVVFIIVWFALYRRRAPGPPNDRR